MGFAPFFDRARQSVGQALRGSPGDELERKLTEVVVTIAFDASAEGSAEARCTLDLAVRLASRLYPRLKILPLHGNSDLTAGLASLARSINPQIDIEDETGGAQEIAFVVGSTAHDAGTTIYAGSDGWLAKVSTRSPAGSGSSGNPFGAGAAACLGMANVFRQVFAECLTNASLDDDAILSLLDFQTGPTVAAAQLPGRLDLGTVQLVGVGAVGNAFVWSIAHLGGVEGTLHLIDHETVELSNIQRYVLTSITDEHAAKVMLAKQALAATKLDVVPALAKWSEYVQQATPVPLELVAVALDSEKDRVQVQGSLPRRIVNAWTQEGDLGISRHAFDGQEACLACLYLPLGKKRSLDEIVAGELGLDWSTHKMRLREMLYRGEPVGEAFAREVATATGLGAEELVPYAGLPLRQFRQRAVCGGLVMRASDGAGADVEVPLAFQSALAGVMLAAETVAEATGLRDKRPGTRSVINLMRPLAARPTSNMLKGTSAVARCICQDADWQSAYSDRWLNPGISSLEPENTV